MKPNHGRVACEVPFCRRTAKASGQDGQQVICGTHWRLADKRLTKRYRRLQKAITRALDRMGSPSSPDEGVRLRRHWTFLEKLWERIKTQAIERAVGISR